MMTAIMTITLAQRLLAPKQLQWVCLQAPSQNHILGQAQENNTLLDVLQTVSVDKLNSVVGQCTMEGDHITGR